MGTFSTKVQRFIATAKRLPHEVHAAAGDLAFESIVHGSSITGAPGQPVAPGSEPNAGELRDSWTKTALDNHTIKIASSDNIARDVEDNLRGVHFSNHGPHSVKLTEVGFPRIVEEAQRQVGGGT